MLLSVGIVVVILFVMLAMSLFCQAMGNFGWDAILEAAGRRLAAGAPAGAPNSGEAAASSPPAYEELFPEVGKDAAPCVNSFHLPLIWPAGTSSRLRTSR